MAGEQGAKGEPGDSAWLDDGQFISHSRGDGFGPVVRVGASYPLSFVGKQSHTVMLGGDETATLDERLVTLAFGSAAPNYSVYGGLGIRVESSGSTLILEHPTTMVTVSRIKLEIDSAGNIDANGSVVVNRLFRASAVSDMGDAFVLESTRSDGAPYTDSWQRNIGFEVGYSNSLSSDTRVAMFIKRGGAVGINTTNPNTDFNLDVVGSVNAESLFINGTDCALNCPSDLRLKKNVHALPDALAQMLRLRGVSYEWISPDQHGGRGGPQIGMVAQEVERVFPDWVHTTSTGTKTLLLHGFEALTVESFRGGEQKRTHISGTRSETCGVILGRRERRDNRSKGDSKEWRLRLRSSQLDRSPSLESLGRSKEGPTL
ncbi:MAG: tail fiber domain-containing protein [Polyangiaceae bacterium]